MTVMIDVTVNGGAQRIATGATVGIIVDVMGYGRRGVAVAVNGAIAPHSTWDARTLTDGDQLEVLTAAQGG